MSKEQILADLKTSVETWNIKLAQDATNAAIAEELALPPVKIHCSILAEDAIKAAINDYRNKQSKE